MGKYDQPDTAFHPYPNPDDIGLAGWVTDALGNVLGWRKLDGTILTVEEAGGMPDDADDGADWWKG